MVKATRKHRIERRHWSRLGYPTLLLIDGDVTSNADAVAAARGAGVEVVQWSTGKALEDVVVEALPLEALQPLIELAVEETSDEGVRTSVAAQLGASSLPELNVASWISEYGLEQVRVAISAAAKGKKAGDGKKLDQKAWFKREDRGECLGELIKSYRASLGFTELAEGMRKVKLFAYQDTEATKSSVSTAADDDSDE